MARSRCSDVDAALRAVILGALLVSAAISARADPADEARGSSDDDALASLLAVLDEETTLATRTRLNRDFVPGMVSVLHGDMLQLLGVRNVLDALALVPGFQVLREANGSGNLSVRGITVPFNAGNTKVLLDSVGLSREESGGNSAVLLLPIERVERIEIMRGPGSSIHGGFAFAGVINVITRKQDARIFFGGDSAQAAAIGGHIGWTAAGGEWQGFAGGAWADHGEDAGPIGQNPDDEVSWASLGVQREAFSLTLHHTDRDQYLAPLPTVRLPSGEQSTAIEVRQAFPLGPHADLETRAAWLENAFASATTGKRFSGRRLEAEVDLFWRPSAAHQVLLRVESARSITDLGSIRLPAEPDPALLETSIRNKQRRLLAFTAQDQIKLNDTLSATLGLRWDDYDDVQSQLSPRLGLVWQAADRHILKAQYARGFRAPTYWELYPRSERDDSLGFQTMDSAEIGYIYRRPGVTARVTVFRSKTNDQIYVVLPPPPGLPTDFDNSNRYRSRGVELEWEQNLGPDLDLLANLSYADSWDSRSTSGPDGDSAVAADWIGNLAAIWRPGAGVSLALRWLHVDDRHAFSGKLDGYDKLDLTLGWRRPAASWLVELGVRNALDEPIDYPFALPFSTVSQYFSPRTWWLSLAWDLP